MANGNKRLTPLEALIMDCVWNLSGREIQAIRREADRNLGAAERTPSRAGAGKRT
jgi:hypothetical protein